MPCSSPIAFYFSFFSCRKTMKNTTKKWCNHRGPDSSVLLIPGHFIPHVPGIADADVHLFRHQILGTWHAAWIWGDDITWIFGSLIGGINGILFILLGLWVSWIYPNFGKLGLLMLVLNQKQGIFWSKTWDGLIEKPWWGFETRKCFATKMASNEKAKGWTKVL